MELDVLIEDDRWEKLEIEALIEAAILSTCAHLQLDAGQVEISVLACDDARIAVLNSEFRDKSGPTNVLSWPAFDLSAQDAGAVPTSPKADASGALVLGDIAIAYETCQREAEEMAKLFADHTTHLIVHGTLHLLGYDHVRDLDATLMQAIESEILGKMGIDDPYRV